MKIGAIFAQTEQRGIGMGGKLPWEQYGIHIKQDMKLFQNLTKSTPECRRAVAMGYNTWMSLPMSKLPGRTNYVISKNHKTPLLTFENIHDCIQHASSTKHDELWFIGGSSIYDYVFRWNIADEIWRTTVFYDDGFPCDTFVPDIPKDKYKRVYHFINKESPIKIKTSDEHSLIPISTIKNNTIHIQIEQFVHTTRNDQTK